MIYSSQLKTMISYFLNISNLIVDFFSNIKRKLFFVLAEKLVKNFIFLWKRARNKTNFLKKKYIKKIKD